MARRLLSSAVKIFDWSVLDPGHRAQPTQTQMQEAMQRLRADLIDMAAKHSVAGWTTADDLEVSTNDDGEHLNLRGYLVMERPN